ncbi:FadR/GntR family transcriptional regulator [Brevibacterium litoralis]|uniref:FadR/GntR family transcriptional regulator n=1 Tax=Brevibacterium litoralis TaxID=3138935 RepID=UPI0032EC2CCE
MSERTPRPEVGRPSTPATRSLVFRRLEDNSRSDVVADRIRQAIVLGFITLGERLPTEHELAATLGTASSTVREALSVLREDGVVDTRRGRAGGTFVTRIPLRTPTELDATLRAYSLAELRDLGDHFTSLMVTSARTAAARAFSHNRLRLENLAATFERARTHQELVTADAAFHVEIGSASHSRRLTDGLIELQAETMELLWHTGHLDRAGSCRNHAAIVRAIVDHDAETAGALAHEHSRAGIAALVRAKVDLAARADLSAPGAGTADTGSGQGASAAQDLTDRTEQVFREVLDRLAEATDRAARIFTGGRARRKSTRARLAELGGTYIDLLERVPVVAGCGVLVRPGLFPDYERGIEWWAHDWESEGYCRVAFNMLPGTTAYYN